MKICKCGHAYELHRAIAVDTETSPRPRFTFGCCSWVEDENECHPNRFCDCKEYREEEPEPIPANDPAHVQNLCPHCGKAITIGVMIYGAKG